MNSNAQKIQLRLVIPQALQRGGTAVYKHAVNFFTERGHPVFPQEKLLRLSKSLPAIVEGEISPEALEQFLCSFPEIDKIVILTSVVAVQVAQAAA
jgi:PII-like signaling protein